jgi:hypothetical protein
MSARNQPSPTQRRPLSIRHEVDATLFGRVEAAHHEPNGVQLRPRYLWPVRSLGAQALSTKAAPFAFVLPSDFRLAKGLVLAPRLAEVHLTNGQLCMRH